MIQPDSEQPGVSKSVRERELMHYGVAQKTYIIATHLIKESVFKIEA